MVVVQAALAALAASRVAVLVAFCAGMSLALASSSRAVFASSSSRRRSSIVSGVLALARRIAGVLSLALASVAGPRGIGTGAQVVAEALSQCFLISSGRQVSCFELLPETVDGHVDNVVRC
jgi:hypothetical protein